MSNFLDKAAGPQRQKAIKKIVHIEHIEQEKMKHFSKIDKSYCGPGSFAL